MKKIQEPTPPKNGLSKGLLSPHDSILDALNICESIEQSSSFKNRENVNSSWLDINNGDYSHLYPINSRSGSSVLSSSPDLDHVRNQQQETPTLKNTDLVFNEEMLLSPESVDAFNFPNLPGYRKNKVEEQLINIKNNQMTYDSADDKILILGSKKYQVYDSLSFRIQENFTIHTNLSPSIILVIFDGLNKIGNILNQLKFLVQHKRSSQNEGEDELVIIPFYKNIDFHVILNLLDKYNLLCNPIRYTNKQEINGVLSTLLIPSIAPQDYINLSDQDDHTIELPLNQNNPVPIRSFSKFTKNNLTIQPSDQVSNKSILIKHQITKSLSSMDMNNTSSPYISKKRRYSKRNNTSFLGSFTNYTSRLFTYKFWQRKKFLIVPLVIGLGIGALLALVYPYFNSGGGYKEEVFVRSSKRVRKDILRNNMRVLNLKLQGLAKYLAKKTQTFVENWDENIVNSTNGHNYTILWNI